MVVLRVTEKKLDIAFTPELGERDEELGNILKKKGSGWANAETLIGPERRRATGTGVTKQTSAPDCRGRAREELAPETTRVARRDEGTVGMPRRAQLGATGERKHGKRWGSRHGGVNPRGKH